MHVPPPYPGIAAPPAPPGLPPLLLDRILDDLIHRGEMPRAEAEQIRHGGDPNRTFRFICHQLNCAPEVRDQLLRELRHEQ
jgi:hypothetical protein